MSAEAKEPAPPQLVSDSLISVVIPLWNEEESMPGLKERLTALVRTTGLRLEFVWVDDGSSDGTQRELRKVLDELPIWKSVKLSRNFGQQAAYRAGLARATGDAVVFLDADMQDPPEMIPALVEEWRNGAKVVIGCRSSRPEKGLRGFLLKRFHDVFHSITGGVMPKDSGTFGLMDRAVADELLRMPELNLFLPALRSWVGFKQSIVWYDRADREVGAPKQTFAKLFSYAWDGITNFSEVPLQSISWLGAGISAIGFLYAAGLVVIKLLQLAGYFTSLIVPGFTTVAVAVLCLGGIQLICLGVVSQYLARIYREVKRRPLYLVETETNSGPTQ
jgi:glycosyltransferase involved in cell wall biosynthesis